MAQKVLNLENLKSLDMGMVELAFQTELTRVVADIKDRPEDEHARKVAVNFIITPADKHGDVVSVECEVVSAVPKRVSRPYEMRVKGDGLMFQPISPDDPEQMDVFDEADRKKRAS